jgi:hypothetical protein
MDNIEKQKKRRVKKIEAQLLLLGYLLWSASKSFWSQSGHLIQPCSVPSKQSFSSLGLCTHAMITELPTWHNKPVSPQLFSLHIEVLPVQSNNFF